MRRFLCFSLHFDSNQEIHIALEEEYFEPL